MKNVRNISVEEANVYMEENRRFSIKLAIAVMMCVLSPIPLIIMGGMSEYQKWNLSEDLAGGLGMAVLLPVIAIAVGIMIMGGIRIDKYNFLEKDPISVQYGVTGIVEKKKKDFGKKFYVSIAVGVVLCIMGVVPLILSSGLTDDEFVSVVCVGILLGMVAVATLLFVWSSVIWGGFDKLLQQGEYSEEKKEERRILEKKVGFVPGVYWCIATAIYLGISLTQNSWERSWIVWPVAAVAFAAVMGIINAIVLKNCKKEQ